MHEHGHGHGNGQDEAHHVDFDSAEAAERIEREGEVLIGLVEQAVDRLGRQAKERATTVERVLDLGAGPGVATCVLAARFPAATAIAADSSTHMLERAAARAERLGLGDQVTTRRVALPDNLPELGPADVVWASMVLHHLGDETAGLRAIRDLVRPGGLLALVERGGPMRVVPDDVDLGRPGIWERLDEAWAAWFDEMRSGLPDAVESRTYPAMLTDAGFDVLIHEELVVDLGPPLGEAARRYAHERIHRAPEQLATHADPADLEALGPLIDKDGEASVLRRPDARLLLTRQFLVATPQR